MAKRQLNLLANHCKYLMEDHKVVRIILSALTKLDIIALEFVPQELAVDKSKNEHSILTG